MRALLDVSVLIVLMDQDHVSQLPAQEWTSENTVESAFSLRLLGSQEGAGHGYRICREGSGRRV